MVMYLVVISSASDFPNVFNNSQSIILEKKIFYRWEILTRSLIISFILSF
jgi:hypothetical protein